MANAYGTRDDCERDNRQIMCPNSTGLGYSTHKAKRGSIVLYEQDNIHYAGRVVGGVTCEGRRYIELICWDRCLTMAYVRWIDPCEVRECYPAPHKRVIDFLMGEWSDPDIILRRAHNGFVREDVV